MPFIGGVPGFYASLGLAVSTNGGASFSKLGPIITSQQPKSWSAYPGQADKGAGEPCCVLSRDGGFLYVYYTEHSRVDGRGVQICVARCDIRSDPPTPGRWQKYYDGFSEPGLGGKDEPVMHMDPCNAIEPFVTFSPGLGKYVMLFGVDCWRGDHHRPPHMGGIFVAYSVDGVTWGLPPPHQVILDFGVPVPDKSVSWHAAIVWDSTERQDGWMVWAFSPKWGGNAADGEIPHYMVGQRVSFATNSP
jgi:hypothetical protein